MTKVSDVPSNQLSFNLTGVYPYFATTASIGTFTKLALTKDKYLQDVSMPSETASDKHSLMIPAKQSLVRAELYNTVSDTYQNYDVDRFTVSTKTIEVQGA